MNAQFPVAMILVVGGVVLLALFVLEFPLGAFRGMSRERQLESPAPRGRFACLFRRAILPVAAVIMLLFVVRQVRTIPDRDSVSTEVATEVHESLREAMQDISEARRDIRDAVREASEAVSIELADNGARVTITAPGGVVTTADGNSEDVLKTAAPQADAPPQPPELTVIAAVPVAPAAPELPAVITTDESQTPAIADVATDPDSPPNEIAGLALDEVELHKRKRELSNHIGQWIRSMLDQSTETSTGGGEVAQAAESSNGGVVVVELSDQMTGQLLGESGHKFLKSFNSDLPGRIRQTYALIPLTPQVDTAVSSVKPLLANEALQSIANSMVSLIDREPAEKPGLNTTATDDTAALAAQSDNDTLPAWIKSPDGGRIVVETEAIPPGEDSRPFLTGVINAALAQHLTAFTETLDDDLRNQTRFVELMLDDETAQQCIVHEFERRVDVEAGMEGTKPFRKVYALLEFPETVDKAAVQQIRQSLQNDRLIGLGLIVASAWLSVCSASCCIRLWRNGGSWLKMTVIPIAGIVAFTLLLCASGLIIAFSKGAAARPLWHPAPQPSIIHVDPRSPRQVQEAVEKDVENFGGGREYGQDPPSKSSRHLFSIRF